MAGALIVVAFALAGVFIGASEKKDGKRRSVPLAAVSAVIGSIALLIAFPNLLSFGGKMSPIALGLVATLGLLAISTAFASKRVPTGIALMVGSVLVTWAAFRWLPTGPVAFQHLANHVNVAGSELWKGLTGFVTDLTHGVTSGKKK